MYVRACACVCACQSVYMCVDYARARTHTHTERERVCCLLVLNLVSSTLPFIRQPGPHFYGFQGVALGVDGSCKDGRMGAGCCKFRKDGEDRRARVAEKRKVRAQTGQS